MSRKLISKILSGKVVYSDKAGVSVIMQHSKKVQLFWGVLMQPTLSTLKNLPHLPPRETLPQLTLPTIHHKSIYDDQMLCYYRIRNAVE